MRRRLDEDAAIDRLQQAQDDQAWAADLEEDHKVRREVEALRRRREREAGE